MMASITASLSLHLLCQLIAQNPGSQSNVSQIDITTGNQTQPQIESSPQSSPVQQVSLPAGYVSHPDIGFAYKIHNETVTFPEAEILCRAEGGHLATIDSEKKLGYVTDMRQLGKQLYVGISQMYGRDWYSIGSGLPVKVLWGKGEPSGSHVCVLIKNATNELGNYPCHEPRNFVCELPIPQHNSAGRN